MSLLLVGQGGVCRLVACRLVGLVVSLECLVAKAELTESLTKRRKWMPFPEPSPHRDEIIEALKAGESVDELDGRFPVSRRTIERYAKKISDGTLEQPPKTPTTKGGELATVLQPSKGAIVFTLGEHKISLNPQHLYDAYLYYEDIAIRHDIDEEFSLAIKDSLKYVWERLNQHKGETQGISITLEGS